MENQKYKASPTSRDKIRRYIEYLRKITGTENDLYFDVINFLEIKLPKLVPEYELEIKPIKEMANKCGETFPATSRIVLREDIYNLALKGDGFARFCVAHELGHLFMNDIDSISLCKLEKGERLKTYEDPEWQADAFAGELLMYNPLIKGMSVGEIAEKCGVTRSAAGTQFKKK